MTIWARWGIPFTNLLVRILMSKSGYEDEVLIKLIVGFMISLICKQSCNL
jgi:hypothetical protein